MPEQMRKFGEELTVLKQGMTLVERRTLQEGV